MQNLVKPFLKSCLKPVFLTLVLLTGAITLTSCAGKEKKDPYLNWEAPKIYNKGHAYLKKGDYNDAITAYESLNSQYPFSPSSKNGDLELIYAYYLSGDPALSLAASSRYIKLYPNDPNAAYAYYMAGVIEFNNGRGFLERYTPYKMSEHQSDNYNAAFSSFNQVLTLFPASPYTQDARRRMVYLNNTMADHDLLIAQYYFDRKAYLASADRAESILVHYPNSPSVIQAIKLLANSYQNLDLPLLAKQANQYYQANQTNQANQASSA